MQSFKKWLMTTESSARTRAATNPGIPAQADLVFVKPPYGKMSFCKKIKQPGVRLDNMKTDVCKK